MLYLQKASENSLITDSFIGSIPDNVQIMLDNDIIGTYQNLSTDINYLDFKINPDDLKDIVNGEHKIKYIFIEEIIKEELCMVKDSNLIEPIFTEAKQIKNFIYEK